MSWIIYLADVLPCFGVPCVIAGFVFMAVWGFIRISETVEEDPFPNQKFLSNMRIWGIMLFVIGIFTPSRRTIYGMYAVDKIEEFVNNDEVIKQIPHKTIECLDKWLDSQLEEDK